MAITTTVTSTVAISGTLIGPETVIIPSVTNAAANDVRVTVAMTTGFQSFATLIGTLPVMTGTKGVWIIPAASQTGTITLKGVTGDTGIPLSNVNPTFLSWDTYTSTAGLTIATATVTAVLLFV